MRFVVRFDRRAESTGPDVVVISADHYSESYREGRLVAYRFLDAEDIEVALVRAAEVVYIAAEGIAIEPPAQPRLDPSLPATEFDERGS